MFELVLNMRLIMGYIYFLGYVLRNRQRKRSAVFNIYGLKSKGWRWKYEFQLGLDNLYAADREMDTDGKLKG